MRPGLPGGPGCAAAPSVRAPARYAGEIRIAGPFVAGPEGLSPRPHAETTEAQSSGHTVSSKNEDSRSRSRISSSRPNTYSFTQLQLAPRSRVWWKESLPQQVQDAVLSVPGATKNQRAAASLGGVLPGGT